MLSRSCFARRGTRMVRRVLLGTWLAGHLACTPAPSTTVTPDAGAEPVEFGERFGLAACDTALVEANPDSRCVTYRAVGGVSMGGGTASRLGFNYPDLFDVVGIMGTPFADNEFFWGMLEDNHMSGFCPLGQLEAVMQDDPARLNDPDDPEVFCGLHDVFPLPESGPAEAWLPAAPGSQCYLFRSDFNHWYRGPDAGRGGGFSRNSLIQIMHDLAAAYGNPLVYNEESNYFPPGVPASWYVPPGGGVDVEAICNNPVVLQGVYNREYNPDGTYPVITFCDGSTGSSGDYDPQGPNRYRQPIEFALAVDLNGNGRRDYGEPLVINNRERYRDVGADGLASVDEPGYDAVNNPDPSGDDWDPLTNPQGQERNLKADPDEPWDDDGLDGVPGTGDFGEGNGVYDLSPALARIFDRSPARYFNAMPESQVARVDVWMDAGVRDFLNTAQISNSLFANLATRVPDAKAYDGLNALPGVKPSGYVYVDPDYSRAAMGQVAYLRYGDTGRCPNTDDVNGDGNHVGPDVVDRLYTLIAFISARIPAEGRDKSIGGEVGDLESPNGLPTDFAFLTRFESEVLGRSVDYGVLLPPDYFLADRQDERYPVLYFFHGQGMSAQNMTSAGLLLWGSMKESARADRIAAGKTDFQRAIIIWPDGECLGDTCWTGNFYADFEGLPRDDRRYEQAVFELMRHVDQNYRTKQPALVPKDL